MTRTRIKVCGTTRREDALAAAALGVDALGFIFAAASPRSISPERAGDIIGALPPFVGRVGVFVDAERDEIEATVRSTGLTQVQLHGTEPVELCRELRAGLPWCSICKAFRIGRERMPADIGSYEPHVDCILLDTYAAGVSGGTGARFDWGLVGRLAITKPLILAGGLDPGNVGAAVAQVAPYAIDVNSGVEDAPGVKNHRLLAELVAAVRRAERG